MPITVPMLAECGEGATTASAKGYEAHTLQQLLPALADGAGDEGDQEDEEKRLDHGDGEQVLEASAWASLPHPSLTDGALGDQVVEQPLHGRHEDHVVALGDGLRHGYARSTPLPSLFITEPRAGAGASAGFTASSTAMSGFTSGRSSMGATNQKRGVPLTVGGVLLLLEGRGEQRGVVHRVVALRMTLRIGVDSLSGAEGLLHLGHQDDVDDVADVHDQQVEALHGVERLIGDEDDEADQTEEVEDEVADEDVTADLDGLGGDHRAHSGNDERAEEAGTRE